MTVLLAPAESGDVEVFRQFLKHCTCVVTAVTKYSELLKAAAEKFHQHVCELLKVGASVKVSKKHSWTTFIISDGNGDMEVLVLCVLLNGHMEVLVLCVLLSSVAI